MKVLALKLITGEDILGELESEDETHYVIINAVAITVVPSEDRRYGPNIGLTPFPPFSEQTKGSTFAFTKKHVIYSYEPAEDFITNYNKVFGSGIIVPKRGKITPPIPLNG
jgi:hypothetical protein